MSLAERTENHLSDERSVTLSVFGDAVLYLMADDARAHEAFVSTLASPHWWKYWTDIFEWKIPPRFRNTSTWQSYRTGLGYTDAWRLEICRRASTVPPETGLTCDPKKYELDQ